MVTTFNMSYSLNRITVFVLVELAITTLAFLLGLSIGITISAGLGITCSAFDKLSDDESLELS